jgi:polyferredoxin
LKASEKARLKLFGVYLGELLFLVIPILGIMSFIGLAPVVLSSDVGTGPEAQFVSLFFVGAVCAAMCCSYLALTSLYRVINLLRFGKRQHVDE